MHTLAWHLLGASGQLCVTVPRSFIRHKKGRQAHGSMQGMRSCQCAVAPAATATAGVKCKLERARDVSQQAAAAEAAREKRQTKQQQ